MKEEVGRDYKLSKPTPGDVLPPAMFHLLKVPQLPQTAPSARDLLFKYASLWEIFLIQTTTYTNHNNVLGSLLPSPGHAVYTSSNDAHCNPEPPARLPA